MLSESYHACSLPHYYPHYYLSAQPEAVRCMQSVYTTFKPEGEMTLPEFIVILGAVWLLASFIPRWHSLRYIAALAVVCTFIFSIIAIGLSIHAGLCSQGCKFPRCCYIDIPASLHPCVLCCCCCCCC